MVSALFIESWLGSEPLSLLKDSKSVWVQHLWSFRGFLFIAPVSPMSELASAYMQQHFTFYKVFFYFIIVLYDRKDTKVGHRAFACILHKFTSYLHLSLFVSAPPSRLTLWE